MKRLDLNIPHEGIALFERLLNSTPGTIRDFEKADVGKYHQGGRLLTGFRRYSFRYEDKPDKDKLLEVVHKVAEQLNRDIFGEEYNIGQVKVKVTENE